MKTWTRKGYEVKEVAFDHDLHQFEVVQDGETLFTITPPDLENQAQIIADLDAGEDVNGWDDGMGNTIYVEKK
ncbi:hypothetical protein [Paenibacillus sp. 1-18]|uniref:hypothetical protein n=1 Tax=Paenibacillus sp. 1-18 TaxID=1333846 RepID=UPI00046FB417|nr:hypothetical protein [Paenibacillus sp. 1-18]